MISNSSSILFVSSRKAAGSKGYFELLPNNKIVCKCDRWCVNVFSVNILIFSLLGGFFQLWTFPGLVSEQEIEAEAILRFNQDLAPRPNKNGLTNRVTKVRYLFRYVILS